MKTSKPFHKQWCRKNINSPVPSRTSGDTTLAAIQLSNCFHETTPKRTKIAQTGPNCPTDATKKVWSHQLAKEVTLPKRPVTTQIYTSLQGLFTLGMPTLVSTVWRVGMSCRPWPRLFTQTQDVQLGKVWSVSSGCPVHDIWPFISDCHQDVMTA